MAEPTPGQLITPGGDQEEPPKQSPAPPQEVAVSIPQSVSNPTPPPQAQPQPQAAEQVVSQPTPSSPAPLPASPTAGPQASANSSPNADGSFAPQLPTDTYEDSHFTRGPEGRSLQSDENRITWSASEYIAHQKSPGWYLVLAGAALAFSAIVYVLTKDFVSVAVILIAAIVFGFYAGRQPRVQQYTLSDAGISIGGKMYSFDQMKTFSVIEEGAFSSITFWPLKRFMPAVSIYYDPQDEEKIVTFLSNFLPMDIEKRDMVDNLMRKIRF